MGKALGQALAVRMPGVPLLCLDGVQLPPGSYLDVAAPIANGQVLPGRDQNTGFLRIWNRRENMTLPATHCCD